MMKLIEVASLNSPILKCRRGIDRLRVVFDHAQLVLVGDLLDRRHVGALAVEVNRDDGLRLRGDRRFDFRRVDALGLRIAVNQHRRGAGNPDGLGRREECVRDA